MLHPHTHRGQTVNSCFLELSFHFFCSNIRGKEFKHFPFFHSGQGFRDKASTSVLVGSSTCQTQSVSHSRIICTTEPHPAWSGDIRVTVETRHGESMEAVCDGDCSYTFSEGFTPVTLTVSPTHVSSYNCAIFILSSWLIATVIMSYSFAALCHDNSVVR